MITKKQIAADILENDSNALNRFAVAQYLAAGIEMINIGEKKRGRGSQKINPLEKMFKKGDLSRDLYSVAKNYQLQFERSNISHHARPNYDGSGVGSIAFKSKDSFYTDAQLSASNYIAKAKNKIISHNYFKTKSGKIVDRGYLKIIDLVFEKEVAISNVEEIPPKQTKTTIERKIKEICEILKTI